MTHVTLKELAERANTSIRSVNRALKGEAGLAEKKREEILKLAAKLCYTPNVAARNLRLQRSNFVGILSGELSAAILLRKMSRLVIQLEKRNYFPLLSTIPNDASTATKIFREWAGFVNHVVVIGTLSPEVQDVLPGIQQNLISVDHEISTVPCNHIYIDRSYGIKDGIIHLARKGRRKLFRCGNIHSREAGLEKALQELRHIKEMNFTHLESRNEFEDGFALGDKIVAGGADAVFFDTDRMAFGFLKYAWKHGIRIPDDISVIGFDDDPEGLHSCPALSSVAHPIDEINHKIVELIEPQAPVNEKFVFPTRFVERESS